MATPSRILASIIPWTEEPGGLQSMGLQRAGHDGVTNTLVPSTAFSLISRVFNIWEGWNDQTLGFRASSA